MLRRTLCTSLFLLGLLSSALFADGMILPDHPEQGWLTVLYHDVTVTIEDGVATTHVDQAFRNTTNRDIEGQYLFPLPPGAVVSSFTMWVDGRVLEGRILDAGEARAIYEDYVRRAIDPALLEYVGRNTLSARIFPIPAGGERRIEITYSEVLTPESGTYRYHYPLDTERFSAHPLGRVSIRVDLETSAPLAALYSPTHALVVERSAANVATASYAASQILPTQDFVLYYSVQAAEVGMTLLSYRAPGEDGFFMLLVNPPELPPAAAAIPKDLVLVLDRSGSMTGEKIAQAKDALRFILSNLNPNDRFAVVAFSDFCEALAARLEPVTSEAVSRATNWAAGIQANGGTDIDAALRLAFSLFETNDRPRFLIFLTDGEPTAGVTDPATIAKNAKASNDTSARVFVFGVGYNVNTVLLDQLAEENRGTTNYVVPGENLEAVLSAFYQKIASPVLADTALAFEGVATYDLLPRVLPDLFRGTQLLALGRYREGGECRVTVSGTAAGVATAYTTVQTFSAADLRASFLPRLWAGRKIAYLLDQIRLYGEKDELVDEVVSLSKRYGIITPYTSFLVDESVQGKDAMANAVRAAASAPASGAQAVQGASALKSLSQAEQTPTGTEAIRAVDDRIYFLRQGVWVDSTYADEETLDIVATSDATFALIARIPWIAPHLAIGPKVILRVGETYVRIGEEGKTTLSEEELNHLAK
jgi:Ca-activated chloride channel family protein